MTRRRENLFTTFEITFASEEDASAGRQRLERAGFSVEADSEISLRAGMSDQDGDAGAKLDAAIEELRYDPLIHWQTTSLERFTDGRPT